MEGPASGAMKAGFELGLSFAPLWFPSNSPQAQVFTDRTWMQHEACWLY